MAFYPRQRVVCIGTKAKDSDGRWAAYYAYWRISVPQRGMIYTVQEVRVFKSGLQFIRLMEIVNPASAWSDARPQEVWWPSSGFRPVEETRLDQFRKHLAPTDRVKEDA